MGGTKVAEWAQVCKEVLTDEECESLARLPEHEAWAYLYGALEQHRIEPEQFLAEKGITIDWTISWPRP